MTSGHSNASARGTSSRCGSTTGCRSSSACSSTPTSRSADRARVLREHASGRSPRQCARRRTSGSPCRCSCPSRRSIAWRRVARATSVGAAAAVAVVAFLGFAAAPDRSGWQDDRALIAAALDRPSGTNDLLIDIVRPTLASRATGSGSDGAGGIGAGQAASAARRLAHPVADAIDGGRGSLRSGGERLGRGRCGRGGLPRAADIADRFLAEHRDASSTASATR